MGRFDSLYAKLPLWAQHGAVSTYGYYWYWIRFGPGYQRHVRAYTARDAFDSNEWERWQNEQLRSVLKIAAEKIPYYRRVWSKQEVRAALEGRLEQLPVLEKEVIRADSRAFTQDDSYHGPKLVFHTSGTTGTPIATIWTLDEHRNSMALREVRSARWAGVSFEMPRATFSGRMVEPNPQSKGPFYRFNLAELQVYFSPFHLRPDTAGFYVDALRKHKIKWLTGYAVSYYLLAKFILEQDLKVPPLSAVITTSEKVTTEMREVMEKAYGCRVYEEYSAVENSLFASECEHGRLHLSPDAGIVEILKDGGVPCEPGEVGEVVATGLLRRYQPFVRYRLGDLAAWDPEPCPCKRPLPILKEIVGRIEDVVVGSDGRQMVRFHGIFVDQPHVREGQIIQETLNRIRVKIVPTDGFEPSDSMDIIRRVQQRLGAEVVVIVEIVTHIPRTKSGKFHAVVSLLPKGSFVQTTGLAQVSGSDNGERQN